MLNKGQKIKVCHITSAHPRYDQRILFRECVSLREAGYEVTLLVNDEMKDENIKGIKIKSTKTSYIGKRIKRMIFGTAKIYRLAVKENADIYHFHDPELLYYALKLFRLRKKVIYDSHEAYEYQIRDKKYLPFFLRRTVAGIYSKIETYLLKRIEGVVFPVKTDKVDFESRAKRVVYVNNMPRKDELPEQEEKRKGRGVCYTGGLTYSRGIYHLAQATSKANVPLYLAGRFESEEFKDKVLNIDDNIHYMGVLSREEVYQLYQDSAIGASTLLPIGQYAVMENLPTKVYEYMAMGMPVILSDIPYNRKVVEQYKFGLLVNPDDVEDIADKISFLVEHYEEARQMGERGREIVLKEWNWSKEEEKLLCFYKAIDTGK